MPHADISTAVHEAQGPDSLIELNLPDELLLNVPDLYAAFFAPSSEETFFVESIDGIQLLLVRILLVNVQLVKTFVFFLPE